MLHQPQQEGVAHHQHSTHSTRHTRPHALETLQIQALEADVEKANARAAEAERSAALREAELSALRHETGLWRAIKEAEATQLSLSAAQLGKQLEREMARAAGLNERLAAASADKVGAAGAAALPASTIAS